MKPKLVMIASAIMLGFVGVTLTFLSAEVLSFLNISTSKFLQLLIQISGGLFFSLAALNWMAKGSTIGGIYNRPIVVANLTHFVIGALTLLKAVSNKAEPSYVIWISAVVYVLFAIVFGALLFRSPVVSKTANP